MKFYKSGRRFARAGTLKETDKRETRLYTGHATQRNATRRDAIGIHAPHDATP